MSHITKDSGRATPRHADRQWVTESLRLIDAEAARCAETHLLRLALPKEWNIDLYLKDESRHPTGSLKHRLARSLFVYGLCNGRLAEGQPVIEASSGSTAVSEAYFAELIGLPFIAVMPKTTSRKKIERIERFQGTCHLVDDPSSIYDESERLARQTGGCFLDQFTYAERASKWAGADNIAGSTLLQMRNERFPHPSWVVVGAGTGGTSATFARHFRRVGAPSRVCVAEPEGSVYYQAWKSGDMSITARGSRIEGIGRPRVEPSFIPELIDEVKRVPDAASVAATRYLSRALDQLVGGSTGTSLWAAFDLISEMVKQKESGSIVALICDNGDRYLDTYFDDQWVREQDLDLDPYSAQLHRFFETAELTPVAGGTHTSQEET